MKPGNDGVAGGVDDVGAGADEVRDVGARSYGEEAAALDRERLGPGQVVVDGVDGGVADDEVGVASRTGTG